MITRRPPATRPVRITGAGDTFMAAHIAAELRAEDREEALESAVAAAADYVAG